MFVRKAHKIPGWSAGAPPLQVSGYRICARASTENPPMTVRSNKEKKSLLIDFMTFLPNDGRAAPAASFAFALEAALFSSYPVFDKPVLFIAILLFLFCKLS